MQEEHHGNFDFPETTVMILPVVFNFNLIFMLIFIFNRIFRIKGIKKIVCIIIGVSQPANACQAITSIKRIPTSNASYQLPPPPPTAPPPEKPPPLEEEEAADFISAAAASILIS